MNVALLNIPQRLNTVLDPVQGQVGIPRRILGHGLQDTARGGEETGQALIVLFPVFADFNFRFLQPLGQFFKGQHRVDEAFIDLSFILFGDARADEYRFGFRMPFLDVPAMRLHRGHHIRQVFQFLWKVLLDQQIDGMAA